MELYNVIVGFFKNGGVFMIPIVIILALGAAIAIERWVFLTITTVKNKALWNAVTPYLKAGNFAGAMQVTQKSLNDNVEVMTKLGEEHRGLEDGLVGKYGEAKEVVVKGADDMGAEMEQYLKVRRLKPFFVEPAELESVC